MLLLQKMLLPRLEKFMHMSFVHNLAHANVNKYKSNAIHQGCTGFVFLNTAENRGRSLISLKLHKHAL